MALAGVVAASIVGLGALSADALNQSGDDDASRVVAEATTPVALALTDRVVTGLHSVERAAVSPGSVPSHALMGTAVVALDAATVVSATDPAVAERVAQALRGLTHVLASARDDGMARIATGPATPGGATSTILAVAPSYGTGAPPVSTAARRSSVTGFVVGLVNVAPTLERAATRHGVEVLLRDDTHVVGRSVGASEATRAPSDAAVVELPVPGGTWTLSVWGAPRDDGATWWVVAGGAALMAALVLVMVAADTRVRRRALHEGESRARERALVTDLSTLVRSSLDLAEVLPDAVSLLADSLDLDRVGVAFADEAGALAEVYSWGSPPGFSLPERAALIGAPPLHSGALDEVLFPFQRHGRIVGALAARPKRALGTAAMRSLGEAAEVIAGAASNAAAYELEQETVRHLVELDQARAEFIGTLSHEIRTPITAITGFAAMLDRSWDKLSPEEHRDFIGRIARNANSLATTAQGLLDFSRLDRHTFRAQPVPMDVASWLRGFVDQMATVFDEYTLTLNGPESLMAPCDAEALERIVANLLSNAAKFSDPGSKIDVTIIDRDGHVELWVDDEGPGIPAAERTRVFRRFYRGSTERAYRTRGAGIGLAVVKEYADAVGARVWIDVSPAGGARFVVSIDKQTTEAALRSAASGAIDQGDRHEVHT